MLPHITAVILAAGQSKRMGEAKLLLPWGGRTILETTIQQIKETQADDILLISGGYREKVEAIASSHDIPTVYNADFATGEMLSSLQTAVRYIQETNHQTEALLVMLGDLPFITSSIIDLVIDAFYQNQSAIVALTYNGRRGHPVLFSHALFADLLAVPPGRAPRDLFQKHKTKTTLIPVNSDVILRDIDTPEEYRKWLQVNNQ